MREIDKKKSRKTQQEGPRDHKELSPLQPIREPEDRLAPKILTQKVLHYIVYSNIHEGHILGQPWAAEHQSNLAHRLRGGD